MRSKFEVNRCRCLACLPVVHRWEGHGAAIQGLSRWRRQWDLWVVTTTQRSTLIGHHSSASAVMLTPTSGAVACSHLSGEDAGWGARIGVGVARVVHRVRVVMLIRTVTPKRHTESHIINTTGGRGPVLDSCSVVKGEVMSSPLAPPISRYGAYSF